MDLVEGILIVAAAAALALAVAWLRGRVTAPPPDVLEDVLGSAHERIDEIELARVRSMLQRR
jgi:hypothetical protein